MEEEILAAIRDDPRISTRNLGRQLGVKHHGMRRHQASSFIFVIDFFKIYFSFCFIPLTSPNIIDKRFIDCLLIYKKKNLSIRVPQVIIQERAINRDRTNVHTLLINWGRTGQI
jgi:hypothetical protein